MNEPSAPLTPGTKAPDFALPSAPDQTFSLDDLQGRSAILVFYPEDWSPVCSDQLALYQQLLPEFRKLGGELVGISVDGVWSHLAFAKDRNLTSPCSRTSSPKAKWRGRTASTATKDGTSERALYVIDARWRRAVELRLAGRDQPWRRRDPARPRRTVERGGFDEHNPVAGRTDHAGHGGPRPHPGTSGRTGDARSSTATTSVRTAVLPIRSSRRSRPGSASAFGSSFATSRSRPRTRTPNELRRPRRRPPPRQLLADARRSLREPEAPR